MSCRQACRSRNIRTRASTRPSRREVTRPEAPSLDRCPLPARISPRRSEPATVPAALPPPGRLPTPVRSPAARAGRARPTGGSRRDGEGQTPPVDFCNRYDPRARPRDPPNPVHPDSGRPRSRIVSRSPLRMKRSSRVSHALKHDQPGFYRPGAGDESPTPPAAIARCESFTPTRFTRTPRVADS